jgi:hypothetical protein
MNPHVKNAADESQVNEAKKKVRHTREQELNDVRFILSTPQGRRFVWRYLDGLFRLSARSAEPYWTYFNEGERNVSLKMQADVVEASPEALLEMMTEAKEGEKKNDT